MVKVMIEKDGELSWEMEGTMLYLIMQGEPGGIKAGAIGKTNVGDAATAVSIGIAGIIKELDEDPTEKRTIAKIIAKFVPEIVEGQLREERSENVQ